MGVDGGGLVAALFLGGCAAVGPSDAGASSAPPSTTASSTAASVPPSAPTLSGFEQQLPLSGTFVSQFAETTGTATIERRSDGSTWVTLAGFSTGEAADLRLYLKEGELVQGADGYWGDTAGYGYEIATISPDAPQQEIPVPGAGTMPVVRTLTVMDYAGADYPSLGSVSLR